MLTDFRTIMKLEQTKDRYVELRFETITNIPVEMCQTREHFRGEPVPKSGLKF